MEDASRSNLVSVDPMKNAGPPGAPDAASGKVGVVDRSPAGAGQEASPVDVKVIDLTQGEHTKQAQQLSDVIAAQLGQLLPSTATGKQSTGAAKYTFLDQQPWVELNSGHRMPMVGLGTW